MNALRRLFGRTRPPAPRRPARCVVVVNPGDLARLGLLGVRLVVVGNRRARAKGVE